MFTFTWSHVALEYSSLKFHASLPYWHEPSLERIRFMGKRNADGSHNITMLLSSDKLLHQFKSILYETTASLADNESPSLSSSYSVSYGRFLLLFAIHRLMNRHLIDFLASIRKFARERVSDRKSRKPIK